MNEISRNRIAATVVIGTFLILCVRLYPEIVANFQYQLTRLSENNTALNSSTLEERRSHLYNQLGYGHDYLLEVVSPMPDSRTMPILRYQNQIPYLSTFSYLHLPQFRDKVDSRFIIGVGVDGETYLDNQAIYTNSTHVELVDKIEVSTWEFKTQVDFDQLEGFILNFRNSPNLGVVTLNIGLFVSPSDVTPLENWKATLEISSQIQQIKFSLLSEISEFSQNRSDQDFKLVVNVSSEDGSIVNLESIFPYGHAIDLREYTIFHKGTKGFSAIRNSFLEEISNNKESSWYRYLQEIENVGII